MNGGNGPTSTPTWVHYLHAAYTPEVAASVRTRISATAGRRYYLSRERAAIARAPLVICNSCSTADTVARCYGVAPARLRVVYYGSDPVAFSWAGDQERLEARRCVGAREGRLCAVFIGALGDRRKGFDLVFEAWRTLSADAAWDVDLVVAGQGAEQDAWAARTATAGLTGRIRFLGFTANIPQLLAASDVLVHPARYEAYGLGVHEGLCRGVPSIVTRSAGVTERMPESLSPLVIADPPDAGQLAAALTTWRSDPDRWRQAARAAGDVLRARTWDAMAAEIAAAVEAA